MNLRPFGSIVALALSAAVFGSFTGYSSSALAAGEKDKDAMKLHDAALDEDYLNLELDKAEKKLKDALKKCGDSGCSPSVLGKLHIALGTVLGGGRQNLDGAKEEFVLALKADPSAKLNDSYTTPELAKAFEKAKEIAKTSKPTKPPEKDPDGDGGEGGGGDKPAGGGDLTHTPPTEQAVNTPVPIYLEVPEDVTVEKAQLKYKPFGETKWRTVDMSRMGKGWGAEIPCKDVTTTGDVKYYIVVTDEAGEQLKAGTQKEPHRVAIKSEIEGDEPTFPGKKPPAKCQDKSVCPPGIPGCEKVQVPEEERGDKGWGSTCEKTQECQKGLYCGSNNTCEEGDGPVGPAPSKSGKKNMVGLGGQLDLMLINTAENVCSGTDDKYYCFYAGTTDRFYGQPIAASGTNGVQGGFAPAGGRILASYDREIINLGAGALGAGAKFGVALGGHPDSDEVPPNNLHLQMVPFPPIHFEARGWFAFGGSMVEAGKIRPYAFAGGGAGKVSASVPVTVCDRRDVNGVDQLDPADADSSCSKTVNATPRKLDAYQISGLGFIAVGGGVTYGITPNFGINGEVKLMLMVPTFAVVVAPSVGPVFAF